jgi:mRNA interferase RelE/StbE
LIVDEVNIKRSAERELDDLPLNAQDRILKRILSLRENPRPIGVKKLHGREGYRIRSGDYRILYAIDDRRKIVDILSISIRENAY